MAKLQACGGCGVLAEKHPWGCVMQGKKRKDGTSDVPQGVDPVREASERGFVAVAVCDACHNDPAHRVRPLKGAFFAERDLSTAVFHAGSNAVALP